MEEPLITWNLFWTTLFFPLCLSVFGFWLSEKLKERDRKEEENHELRAELEKEKEKLTAQWRSNQTDILCRMKQKVDNIYVALDSKVDKEDCDRLMSSRR